MNSRFKDEFTPLPLEFSHPLDLWTLQGLLFISCGPILLSELNYPLLMRMCYIICQALSLCRGLK